MRDPKLLLPLLLLCAIPAFAATKESGNTTLKDLQPVDTTNPKDKQQFDFSFESSGKKYVCRSGPKTSVNATDFVVGSALQYEVKGDSGKLKSSSGKEVKCTIIRVQELSASH